MAPSRSAISLIPAGGLDGIEVVGSGNPEMPCLRMHCEIFSQRASVCADGGSEPGWPPPGRSLWHFACAALNRGAAGLAPAGRWGSTSIIAWLAENRVERWTLVEGLPVSAPTGPRPLELQCWCAFRPPMRYGRCGSCSFAVAGGRQAVSSAFSTAPSRRTCPKSFTHPRWCALSRARSSGLAVGYSFGTGGQMPVARSWPLGHTERTGHTYLAVGTATSPIRGSNPP
jgi:hypothetical protein